MRFFSAGLMAVAGVDIILTTLFFERRVAGFIAGTVPTKGIGKVRLKYLMAYTVPVLQATTTILQRRAIRNFVMALAYRCS